MKAADLYYPWNVIADMSRTPDGAGRSIVMALASIHEVLIEILKELEARD